MRVLAPPPVRQLGLRLAESAAAEQRKSSSNNRQKLKRRLPVVRMHTIERLRLAYKDAAIPSIEGGHSGNSRYPTGFANTDLFGCGQRPPECHGACNQLKMASSRNILHIDGFGLTIYKQDII